MEIGSLEAGDKNTFVGNIIVCILRFISRRLFLLSHLVSSYSNIGASLQSLPVRNRKGLEGGS